MIDVEQALHSLPHFDRFRSVAELRQLAEGLVEDARFAVEVIGRSEGGHPIHHVRCGKGATKALFVAFPHAMEPIGGLTVAALLHALEQGLETLWDADVEWHVVPCIDPDGALLNEGWTQQPFDIGNFMRHFFLQSPRDQVDNSFPVAHKRLIKDQPSREAAILKALIDRERPDFFFTLHNSLTGGAFYMTSQDLGAEAYHRIHDFLTSERFPLQKRVIWTEFCKVYDDGIAELFTSTKYYDYLEKLTPDPEKNDLLCNGTNSWDYLARIKPSAVTFVAELGYVTHPAAESEIPTGKNLRKFKLKVEASSKYVSTILLQTWEQLKDQLDPTSPFYRAVIGGGTVLPSREQMIEGGLPISRIPTRQILFDEVYDREMTEADRYKALTNDGGFIFLLFSYQFVRMLRAAPPTPEIEQAIARLETVYDEALAEIAAYIDFDRFQVTDCDTLARIQLGSGLIALNAVLGHSPR